MRALAGSSRAYERMVAGALAFGAARGLRTDAFQLRTGDGWIRILDDRGDLFLELDDERGRDLGPWDLRRLGDRRPVGNAPAFCRSGEGHPVWGREWCLEKGFGLGGAAGTLWSRGGIEDVIYRRPVNGTVDRGGIIDVLGDVVFGRLALHALSLGYADPLVGTFVADPAGPRLMKVRSGEVEIAEFVDADRDDRFEVLYVVQPR